MIPPLFAPERRSFKGVRIVSDRAAARAGEHLWPGTRSPPPGNERCLRMHYETRERKTEGSDPDLARISAVAGGRNYLRSAARHSSAAQPLSASSWASRLPRRA